MRQTTAHKQILKLLQQHPGPVSVEELLKHIPVNKTTIYRQLDALRLAGLVSDVRFTDRKIRYELTSRGHHHHLVCTTCNSVSDVTLTEDLEGLASQTAAKKRFLITSHYLEFFGLCQNCQST